MNKLKISKLISYLIAHDQYGYQTVGNVFNVLKDSGWTVDEINKVFNESDRPFSKIEEELDSD